jgi:crossover junction endodeoxyribonuclease RuvC
MRDHTPDVVAIERLYFNKNQRTAMRVAEMRGVVVYLAEQNRSKVVEYTPQQIKVAVTGYGASNKKQVASMVARLIPMMRTDALDDEYDAVAVALTALASIR